jgi:L-iditol 2-dehydrogenase
MPSPHLVEIEPGAKLTAAVFEGNGHFALKAVPVPSLTRGEMLLKVIAVGICGTDLKIFSGRKHAKPLPSGDIILGHELVGEVVAPGNASTAFTRGQLVMVEPDIYCGKCRYCLAGATNMCQNTQVIYEDHPGAFAQFLVVPEQAVCNGQVHLLPDTLPPDCGTLIEPLACVIHGQDRLLQLLTLRDTALILGGGPIGTMHALLALANGFKQIVLADTNPSRVRLLQDRLSRYPQIKCAAIDGKRQLADLNGDQFDMVVQACPDITALNDGFSLVARAGGLLAFAGLSRGDLLNVDAHKLHYQDIHIIGSANYRNADVRKAILLLSSGVVPGETLISQTYPLERIQEAMSHAQTGNGLKMIIKPN